MDPIVAYLKEEKLPEDKLEARKIRLRLAQYNINRETLYKRGFLMPYLRYVLQKKVEYVLKEVHKSMVVTQ